jgi:hypothetical protein
MPITDLTLGNPLIRGFMEGSSAYVPTGELIYVHTHLIQKNFLSDIESMVSMVEEINSKKKIKPKFANKLERATVELGGLLPKVSEDTASRILYILRDVYLISKIIISSEQPNEVNNQTVK